MTTDSDLTEKPKLFVAPTPGEAITSSVTNNTYVIGNVIGYGSFGIVYSCVDFWGSELAVKVMKPNGSYEDVRRRTASEIDLLNRLRHPCITYVYDAFECRDTFYIVTERCSNPLSNLMGQEWFKGENWIRGVARSLLQALHYLHINGYVHHDIHSGNIFTSFVKDEMGSDEMALVFKLGDLGITKRLDEVHPNCTRNNRILAPEQLNPDEFGPLDNRIDIYYCGLFFLELLNGREITFTEDQILDGAPRRLAESLEMPWSYAVSKALRRHVPYRTANPMEFWRDLS